MSNSPGRPVEMPEDLEEAPSWLGLEQQIIYLAQFGSSIQVVHGELGAGKTELYQHLLQQDLGASLLGVKLNPADGLGGFLRSVLDQLGLRPSKNAATGELMVMLRRYIQALRRERARVVLLVDDADRFSDPELAAIISLLQDSSDAGVGLHMVMLGLPGLADRIDTLNVLDVAVHDVALPPPEHKPKPTFKSSSIVADEPVKLPEQLPFPELKFDVADREFATPPADRPPQSGWWFRDLPIGHLTALILLSCVLIWAFLGPKDESVVNVDDAGNRQTPVAAPQVPPSIQNQDGKLAVTVVQVPQNNGQSSEKQLQSLAIAASETDGVVDVGANLDAQSSAIDPNAPSKEPVIPVVREASTDDSENNPVLRESPTGTQLTAQKAALSVKEASPAKAELSNTVQAPIEDGKLEIKPSAHEQKQTKSKTGRELLSEGERQLLAFPASGYVLQLMGSSALGKLETYAIGQTNRNNLRLYAALHDGKPLYILVEGNYPSKAAALAARGSAQGYALAEKPRFGSSGNSFLSREIRIIWASAVNLAKFGLSE
jgi:DamX protein